MLITFSYCAFLHHLSMLWMCCLATSGAVNEETFDRSFGQVPVINVSVN